MLRRSGSLSGSRAAACRLGRGRVAAGARLAAIALALTLTLSACPSPVTAPRFSPPPKAGGSVRVAYPSEPTTLDPFAVDAPATRDLARLLMPSFYGLGPAGERRLSLLAREPAVAEGPPFTVTVDLRTDAVWSDGTPITASDVRATWKAVAREPAASGYERISDVVVESPTRARLVFGSPFRRWRDLFSAGLGVLPVAALRGASPEKALARGWPVSGGPFVLAKWTPGLEMVFERNPRAWPSPPLLDEIRVVFVPDATTALQLFLRREVDVLAAYEAIDFSRRAREAGASVSSDLGPTAAFLALDARHGRTADVRVRRALALALDRERMVAALVGEEGNRLDGLLPGDPSLDHAVFPSGADPVAARALLAKSGWTGAPVRARRGVRLEVRLAFARDSDLEDRVARAIRAQAAAVGIDVVPVGVDARDLARGFEAVLVVRRDPPGGSLSARFASGPPRGLNASGIADVRLDSALGALERTTDGAGPAALAVLERLATLVPAIPLYRVRVSLAFRDAVHGARANASADGPFSGVAQWWLE